MAGVIRCDLRDSVQQELFVHGVWEPQISTTIGQLLRPGDVFIDVGANVGYFSLLGAQCVGPKGIVLAFEPLPGNVGQLVHNLAANAAENVVVYSLALGHELATLTLYSGAYGSVGQTSVRPISGLTCQVACCPLDAIIGPELHARVRLVKIDVEGAELHVLKGMRGLLAQSAPPFLICELTDRYLREVGQTATELIEFVRGFGYSTFVIARQSNEVWGEIDEIAPPPTEQVDVLFVPRDQPLPMGLAVRFRRSAIGTGSAP
jgi:FkbM family methyltransferase